MICLSPRTWLSRQRLLERQCSFALPKQGLSESWQKIGQEKDCFSYISPSCSRVNHRISGLCAALKWISCTHSSSSWPLRCFSPTALGGRTDILWGIRAIQRPLVGRLWRRTKTEATAIIGSRRKLPSTGLGASFAHTVTWQLTVEAGLSLQESQTTTAGFVRRRRELHALDPAFPESMPTSGTRFTVECSSVRTTCLSGKKAAFIFRQRSWHLLWRTTFALFAFPSTKEPTWQSLPRTTESQASFPVPGCFRAGWQFRSWKAKTMSFDCWSTPTLTQLRSEEVAFAGTRKKALNEDTKEVFSWV